MLKADCVCIQEVESTSALELVNQRLKSPYSYSKVFTGNYYRGLHLGTLIRAKQYSANVVSYKSAELTDEDGVRLSDFASPEDAQSQTVSPLQIQRDILQTEISSVRGVELTVYNVHLKSHAQTKWRLLDNDVIRGAEVDALISTVQQYRTSFPERPLCIAGDLNESEDRPILKKLIAELQLHDVLEQDWVKANKTPSYSYQKYPSRSRLDYLLLNDKAKSIYIEKSACIHGSPSGRVASDHYPVSADFRFPSTQTER